MNFSTKILISTLLVFLTVSSANADWTVPAQQEFNLGSLTELPKVVPTGEVPEQLEWLIYGEDGSKVPSEVVGKTFVLLTAKPGLYRIFVWKSGSPNETRQSVVVLKGGDRPEPVTPSGGEGPYPDLTKAVADGIKGTTTVDAKTKKADAITLFFYYGLMSERVVRDGEKKVPTLKTITDVNNLMKAAEKDILGDTPLSPLGTRYPTVSKAAADKFRTLFSGTDDTLTPEKRKIYTDFFKCMSLGAAGSAFQE